MKQFDEIDPLTIEHDPAVVARQQDDRDTSETYYILVKDDHSIIASRNYFIDQEDASESEWLTNQLEMPKAGLPWIVDTLENKFFKMSYEGGLPKGIFDYLEEVEGEKLVIGRAASAGGDGVTGYSLTNLSRETGMGFHQRYIERQLSCPVQRQLTWPVLPAADCLARACLRR